MTKKASPRLVVCAIFRNEARYLREWIEFHRMVGVKKFYLYNNRSDDNWQEVLADYTESGIVEVTDWPYRMDGCQTCTAQISAYQHCIDRLKGTNQWLAIIDIDEFLFSSKYATIMEAVKAMPLPEKWSAVAVSWVLFGSSGHISYEDTPVIERFSWRPSTNTQFSKWTKNILNMEDKSITLKLSGGHYFGTTWGSYNELGQLVVGPQSTPVFNVLRLNHYITKSQGEFDERHPVYSRNRLDFFQREEAKWASVQAKEVEDTLIHSYLPELRKRLGIKRKLALTFDDGPNGSCTEALLKVLERYQVPATFFMIGQRVFEDEKMVARVKDAGHVLGNHTLSHLNLTGLSPEEIQKELDHPWNHAGYFRPPMGMHDHRVSEVADNLSMKMVLWDIDSFDWRLKTADEIVACVDSQVGQGGIIILHDGDSGSPEGNRWATVEAVDRIIAKYKAKGFEFVPLSEMELPGTPRKVDL